MTDLRKIIADWRENGTPGPWAADRPWEDGEIWVGANHPVVGRVTHATIRSGCGEADELGSMDANAAFIAAAPDMAERIEALETALRRVEYWLDTDEEILAAMPADERASHERLHRMVRAVLEGKIDG